ncbi:MAG TPA: [protein-PII] uridylyltransferase [Micromonosporaceae bacterium]|nr:[protein-PII] uridylyltransferase [Micromonosporaceae bacterium]
MTDVAAQPGAPGGTGTQRPGWPGFPDALLTRVGAVAREQRATALHAWLATLLPADVGPGVALVAVGGLGRRECAPYSDLDLAIIHDGRADVDELAASVWYAVWDAKLSLDQSTRSLDEALGVAADDLKAALGMLDARLLAGDAALAARLHNAALEQWQREGRRRLPELAALTRQRWQAHGELAFLLEGDVKESRGGLRDFGVLRGIGLAGAAGGTRPAVRASHRFLLDVRDALHAVRGRRVDRLMAQDRDEVARLLGLGDRDDVLRRISESARTVAHATDDAWRAVDRWAADRTGPSTRRPIGRDVVEQNGEAVLARAAVTPRPDPSLALRVAAAAARADLPIARPTLEWLAAFSEPLPQPWPASARDALLTLIGSGAPLVPTWEACDRHGLVTTWLPEWARVRSLPQHNPVHRFTVDRHLVETACNAAGLAREVDRPDLLVLSALLHDIGKGLPGDHSTVGAPIAAGVAARLGLPPADVEVVRKAVLLHLLLPDTATRRDLADPVTIRTVADAVGDVSTLALLHALARADAAATGPAAWSTWKGRLVAELVYRVTRALDSGEVAPLPVQTPPVAVPAQLPAIHVDHERVVVMAQDRPGLLAAVAGCIALHRLDVVAADATSMDPYSRITCAVQPRYGAPPDVEALTVDLRRAVSGELDVAGRLAARDRSAGRPSYGRSSAGPTSAAPRVVWHPATDAAVLEVRAADSPGLLYRLARALEGAGTDVRAARISTLGGDVVDAFYLVGEWTDAKRAELEPTVLAAASPPG